MNSVIWNTFKGNINSGKKSVFLRGNISIVIIEYEAQLCMMFKI
jgi:hypothetical protein